MNPIAHAFASYLPHRKRSDVIIGLLPDLPNLLLVTKRTRLPETDWRVRASRVSHSPLIVVIVLVMSRGEGWAYALHWLMDSPVHPAHQWLWPFRRKHVQ